MNTTKFYQTETGNEPKIDMNIKYLFDSIIDTHSGQDVRIELPGLYRKCYLSDVYQKLEKEHYDSSLIDLYQAIKELKKTGTFDKKYMSEYMSDYIEKNKEAILKYY